MAEDALGSDVTCKSLADREDDFTWVLLLFAFLVDAVVVLVEVIFVVVALSAVVVVVVVVVVAVVAVNNVPFAGVTVKLESVTSVLVMAMVACNASGGGAFADP